MKKLVQDNKARLLEILPLVNHYKSRLDSLGEWWGKIALIGKINSLNVAATILADMEETKGKFSELQHNLIHNLLEENLKKLILSDTSIAQVAIDVLIRNLFERTADVGFLATDDDIREFLTTPEVDDDNLVFIENRLSEYVKKYSVYDEIIILDARGSVRAHLDKNNPVTFSSDPLIEETLNTEKDYVETFKHSDLQPGQENSLVYSCKITRTNDAHSPVLGILCLCFRFDDEMNGIFSNLMQSSDHSTMMIMDNQDKVIASNNTNEIPVGTRFPKNSGSQIITYRDKECFISTTMTNGYQGFYGLGWGGQVVTRIDTVFGQNTENVAMDVSTETMGQSSLFSAELKEIWKDSIDINEDLSLVVLNGKITAARKKATEFMPVLEAIKQIGEDTASIFDASINNLLSTVISSLLSDARFLAALAVDIMDRNLYERANDCRWWALTSAFRRILLNGKLSDADIETVTEILAYINDLYTVYTNLYLYDKSGRILAVSNDEENHIIGKMLDEQTGASATLKIHDSQQYAVSAFVKTPLYSDRHTYIYNAPITSLDTPEKTVGGIGIVFDSEPQFKDMLTEVLPRDEKGRVMDNCFAVFTDRASSIISVAHNSGLKVGDKLNIDNRYFHIENGFKHSEIIQYNDSDYALGVAVSKGYREYKTTEDYSNDVLAFVFTPF